MEDQDSPPRLVITMQSTHKMDDQDILGMGQTKPRKKTNILVQDFHERLWEDLHAATILDVQKQIQKRTHPWALCLRMVPIHFSHGHRRRRAVSFRLSLTEWWCGIEWWTLSEKWAGAGHRAVILHRDCVLVWDLPPCRRPRVKLPQMEETSNSAQETITQKEYDKTSEKQDEVHNRWEMSSLLPLNWMPRTSHPLPGCCPCSTLTLLDSRLLILFISCVKYHILTI